MNESIAPESFPSADQAFGSSFNDEDGEVPF